MIKIDFEITKDEHTFKDAIHLPEDHTHTDDDIEAMKQKRFDDWYTLVTTEQPEEEIVEVLTDEIEEFIGEGEVEETIINEVTE